MYAFIPSNIIIKCLIIILLHYSIFFGDILTSNLHASFKYIDEHFGEAVSELKRICAQPSVSAKNEGLEECANLIKELLENIGAKVKLLRIDNAPPLIYGELKSSSATKTLLFYNHYDVQPPEPLDEWKHPPFQPVVENGKIYARGVSDNKGNIIARIYAIKAILNTIGELPVNIKFVIEGEEEIGSPHLPLYVEKYGKLFKADGGIWESGSKNSKEELTIYLGVKGILYVELIARGPSRDVHSAGATLIPNPAWRLIRALSTLKDENEQILIPGFYDAIVPPSEEELEYVRKIEFDTDKLKKGLGLKKLLFGLEGFEALKRNLYAPTCNICGLLSGYTGPGGKTVLPSTAMAKLDFRLVPNQDPEDIYEKLKEYLKMKGYGDIEVKLLGKLYPAKTSLNSAIVKATVNAAITVYGKPPVIYPTMAGSGPMYLFIKNLGIPISSTGVGYYGSRAHAPNENIRIKDFIEGMKHVIAIIFEFSKI